MIGRNLMRLFDLSYNWDTYSWDQFQPSLKVIDSARASLKFSLIWLPPNFTTYQVASWVTFNFAITDVILRRGPNRLMPWWKKNRNLELSTNLGIKYDLEWMYLRAAILELYYVYQRWGISNRFSQISTSNFYELLGVCGTLEKKA